MVPGITFANLDHAAFGGGAGTLAGQCANDVLGGTGKALIIQQKEGTSGKAEIDTAIVENLAAAAPGVEVVATIITTERGESLTKVSQVLQANPDINVVVSAHDEGGLGALGAFEAAGKEIPCLVDMGGNAEVLAAVESGAMYGAVALNFEGDLMQTFDAIKTMLADPSALGRQQTIPLTIKTRP
jgi:ribose transport system substrate-binding protein